MKKHYIAAIVTLVYIPLITILSELVKPVNDFLKKIFWHHWVGKGVILILLYAVIAGILSTHRFEDTAESDRKFIAVLSLLMILGGLSIFIFFSFDYAIHF